MDLSGLYFLPTRILKGIRFPSQQSDAEYLFYYCSGNAIPIYQIENGLVLEHQDGLGQQYRKNINNSYEW